VKFSSDKKSALYMNAALPSIVSGVQQQQTLDGDTSQ